MGVMPPSSAIPPALSLLPGGSTPAISSLRPLSSAPLLIPATTPPVSAPTGTVTMSVPALAVVGGTSEQALSPSATLTGAAANTVLQGGLSMGESLSPLPTKVVEKIVQLKYVEMSELLPETWQVKTNATLIQSALGLAPGLRRRKGPVTDILQWVQCFATLASVLASAYPSKVPELMAYLATIVKCWQEFEGPA